LLVQGCDALPSGPDNHLVATTVADIPNHLFDTLSPLLQQLLPRLASVRQDLSSLLVDPAQTTLQRLLLFPQFHQADLGLLFGFGQRTGSAGQLAEQLFDLESFLAHQPSRLLQQVVGEAPTLGDVEGVTGSGHADLESETGTKGLLVIRHGRVDHLGMVEYRRLQQAEMGRSQHVAAAGGQPGQDGESEGGPFLGIGAAPDLVAQHESRRVSLTEEIHEMTHVRREAAQRHFDGLLVTEIDEKPPDQR